MFEGRTRLQVVKELRVKKEMNAASETRIAVLATQIDAQAVLTDELERALERQREKDSEKGDGTTAEEATRVQHVAWVKSLFVDELRALVDSGVSYEASDPSLQRSALAKEAYAAERFAIGDRVVHDRKGLGMVRYVGPIDGRDEVWIGVELIALKGEHDGSVITTHREFGTRRKRYFECEWGKGLFSLPANLALGGIEHAMLTLRSQTLRQVIVRGARGGSFQLLVVVSESTTFERFRLDVCEMLQANSDQCVLGVNVSNADDRYEPWYDFKPHDLLIATLTSVLGEIRRAAYEENEENDRDVAESNTLDVVVDDELPEVFVEIQEEIRLFQFWSGRPAQLRKMIHDHMADGGASLTAGGGLTFIEYRTFARSLDLRRDDRFVLELFTSLRREDGEDLAELHPTITEEQIIRGFKMIDRLRRQEERDELARKTIDELFESIEHFKHDPLEYDGFSNLLDKLSGERFKIPAKRKRQLFEKIGKTSTGVVTYSEVAAKLPALKSIVTDWIENRTMGEMSADAELETKATHMPQIRALVDRAKLHVAKVLAPLSKDQKTRWQKAVYFIVAIAAMITSLLVRRNLATSFHFYQMVERSIATRPFGVNQDRTMMDIRDWAGFDEWFLGPLADTLLHCADKNDCPMLYGMNRVFGPLRVRQLRMRQGYGCDGGDVLFYRPHSAACYGEYVYEGQSTASYGTGLDTWENRNGSGAFTWKTGAAGTASLLGGRSGRFYSGEGGFISNFAIEGTSSETARAKWASQLGFLRSHGWWDHATSAVIVNMYVYNPSINRWVDAAFLFEQTRFGSVVATFHTSVSRVDVGSTAMDKFLLIFDVFCFLGTMAYILHVVIRATFKLMRRADSGVGASGGTLVSGQISIFNHFASLLRSVTNTSFLRMLKEILMERVLGILIVVSYWTSAFVAGVHFFNEERQLLAADVGPILLDYRMLDFGTFGILNELYYVCYALCVACMLVQAVGLWATAVPRFKFFSSMLYRRMWYIGWFYVFFTVWLGFFALVAYTQLGTLSDEYDTYRKSVDVLLSHLVGFPGDYDSKNRELFFFLALFAGVVILVLRVLLTAVMNNAYATETKLYDERNISKVSHTVRQYLAALVDAKHAYNAVLDFGYKRQSEESRDIQEVGDEDSAEDDAPAEKEAVAETKTGVTK